MNRAAVELLNFMQTIIRKKFAAFVIGSVASSKIQDKKNDQNRRN